MIRDITLGQYYAKDSVIHRLDPRVKITGTFAYLVLLFLIKDFIGFGFVVLCLAGLIAASGVPFRFIMRGMKPIMFILVFTFCINIFLYKGTIIWQLGFLTITKEGLRQAVFIAARLALLIFGTSLLTYTTKPMALTDGFEAILRPFARIGVPAHEIAMMMSIALRFIPTLLEETDKIMKAQQARGADFESGNLLQRAKALIPILIPLFVSACNCYGSALRPRRRRKDTPSSYEIRKARLCRICSHRSVCGSNTFNEISVMLQYA